MPPRFLFLTIRPRPTRGDDHDWLTTDEGKEYYLASYQGREVRVYRSGVVYDMERKKALVTAKNTRISPDSAYDYHKLNQTKLVRGGMKALEAKYGSVEEGLRKNAGAILNIIEDGKHDRDRVRAFETFNKSLVGGYLSRMPSGHGPGGPDSSERGVIKDLITLLERAIELKKAAEAEAGEIIDISG